MIVFVHVPMVDEVWPRLSVVTCISLVNVAVDSCRATALAVLSSPASCFHSKRSGPSPAGPRPSSRLHSAHLAREQPEHHVTPVHPIRPSYASTYGARCGRDSMLFASSSFLKRSRRPNKASLQHHSHVMNQARRAGAMSSSTGEIIPAADHALQPVAVLLLARRGESRRPDHRLDDRRTPTPAVASFNLAPDRLRHLLVSARNKEPPLRSVKLDAVGKSPLTVMRTPLAYRASVLNSPCIP